MANAGLQAPAVPAPSPPPALQQPAQPTQQVQQAQIIHVNWSHFKPEFSGKPEEDAVAHLI